MLISNYQFTLFSTVNPVFIYEGQTSFNLVFPITELFIYPLYAEYRYNNQQKIADSELSVYYMDGITKVSGTIMLLDINMRSYSILFSNPLPPVTELVIELDLLSQLGNINNFTLNVLSHGKTSYMYIQYMYYISYLCIVYM